MSTPVSLRWKVAATVSVLLIAVTCVIGLALIRYLRLFLVEEAGKRAATLAETLAVSARDPLLEADELRLGPVIESIMQDPDAVYAYVLDHEGVVAFHADTQLIGSRIVSSSGPPEKLLEASAEVVVEDIQVGEAYVGLSTEFVDRAVRTVAEQLLFRLGLGTLFGLGGILLLTDFHLRRLARLEHAVHRIAEGDLAVRARVRGRDELARLGRGFNSMVARLEAARQEIERGVTETVSALASTIDVNDAYTHGHCERVAQGTAAVAERMGVEGQDLKEFELAAMLHDIGKIGVPTQVLAKKGKLTKAEYRQMQEHAALGARILSSVSFLGEIPTYVRHHHENWDGSGYPDGLAGDEVPLAARIIHLVDAYDAITSSRPYRRALAHEEAIRRIGETSGTQFDPEIVDVFLELVDEGIIRSIRQRVDEEAA